MRAISVFWSLFFVILQLSISLPAASPSWVDNMHKRLENIKTEKEVEVLAAELSSPTAATEDIVSLYRKQASGNLSAKCLLLLALVPRHSNEKSDLLAKETANDKNACIREATFISALGDSENPELVRNAISKIRAVGEKRTIKMRAARYLAHLGHNEGKNEAIKVLSDSVKNNQATEQMLSAAVFEEEGTKEDIPSLNKLKNSRSAWTRMYVEKSIAAIEIRESKGNKIEVIKKYIESPSLEVRYKALEMLATDDSEDCRKLVKELLSDNRKSREMFNALTRTNRLDKYTK